MKRLAMCALSTVFMFAAVAYAEDKTDPMADVSPEALLRADQFDKLEAYYSGILKKYNPKTANSYDAAWRAIDGISYSSDLPAHLDRWVAAKPNSPVARLIRGGFYIEHAWAARGSGFANTVSRQGWEEFGKRLELANADLTAAAQLDPHSPFPYAGLITIDMGMSRGVKSAAEHLAAARAIDPSFYPAHSNFMFMNTPRWGGSLDAMKAIAEKHADSVPGSVLPLLWVGYHEEAASSMNVGELWWKEPGVWEQVDGIFKKTIPLRANPSSLRSWYADTAFHAGHPEIAREQLDLLGPDWKFSNRSLRYVFYLTSQVFPGRNAYEWMVGKATAALQKNPRSAQALMMRGVACVSLDRDDQAIADLKKALEIDPDLTECWSELAIEYRHTKQYAQAIEAADRYLLSHAHDDNTIALKGHALRDLGKIDDAIAWLEGELEKYPSLPTAHYALGCALVEKHDLRKTVAVAERGRQWAVSNNDRSNQVNLNWLLGNAHAGLNQRDQAFDNYVEALKLDDGEFMIDTFANLYTNGSGWEPYRERIVKTVEQNFHSYPKDKTRHDAVLAKFRQTIAKPQTASKTVSWTFDANPEDPDGYVALAESHMRAKQYDKGLETCLSGLKAFPQNADLREEQGRFLEALSRQADAIAVYRKLIAEKPAEPRYYEELMRCYVATKQEREAAALCEDFFKNCPVSPPEIRSAMLTRRIDARSSGGGARVLGTSNAINDLDEAIRLNPNDPNLYYKAGWECFGRADQLKKGIGYARKATALRKPPWAPDYSLLGMLLKHDGQKKEATEAFNQALKIDPKDGMALSGLKNMAEEAKPKP